MGREDRQQLPFKERKAQGLIPAGKDIGGEIGIHGVPDGYDHWIDAGEDWTWGCIALTDKEIEAVSQKIVAAVTKATGATLRG